MVVAFGGTLRPDHGSTHLLPEGTHPIATRPGSIVHRLLGRRTDVTSLHHQAPGDFGPPWQAPGSRKNLPHRQDLGTLISIDLSLADTYALSMDVAVQLSALADPTRRRIFDLVREAPASVSQLSDRLPISQPAVSQHLKVLREARLVRSARRGARSIYSPDKAGIAALRDWLDSVWDDVLDAYVHMSEEEAAE